MNPNIRNDFPALHQKINGHDLIYFDNAATTFKPQTVIDKLNHHYTFDTANIHRGVHTLGERPTAQYEETRVAIQHFINAKEDAEIIFTKGSTESVNLVASSFGLTFLKAGDEVLVSQMEHHSNFVPWQMICELTGAKFQVIPINEKGEINMEEYQKKLSSKTKMIAFTAISNSLGTINPIAEMIRLARIHSQETAVLIDAAQLIAHHPLDVQALDADFVVFSGHKMYGPTGVGVLYGKRKWLELMRPYQGGGNMIESVTLNKTTYNVIPHKFEAGTPPIAEVIALKPAIEYLLSLGWDELQEYEHKLTQYAVQKLLEVPGLRLIGTATHRSGIISFVLDKVHPHDIGTFMDQYGIALRTGHHCTGPVMEYFKVAATARVSFAPYNLTSEVDRLQEALIRTVEFFS